MAAPREDRDFSDRLLAAIVASSDDAIISKTVAGVVTTWNRSAERIFGYSADEIIGQPIAMLAVVGHEGEMPAVLEQVRRGERIEHFETTRRHKDGSTVYISLSVSPIHDAEGNVVGASKVARDIGANKVTAAALALAQTLLHDHHRELFHAARLGELGMMAATLAHEINQPLSSISHYLAAGRQLLSRGESGDDALLQHALLRASDEVFRASEVVRRLRDYAKPNDFSMKPDLLSSIIDEAASLATIATVGGDVLVSLVHESEATLVIVDRIEIQQVLLNLIRNACEAMVGQHRRELQISSRTAADMVEVRVSDTGAGVEQSVRDRLFQAFASTKADGMGIGLSICSKIIGAHGGKLWAEHIPGGGTAFIFTVQLA